MLKPPGGGSSINFNYEEVPGAAKATPEAPEAPDAAPENTSATNVETTTTSPSKESSDTATGNGNCPSPVQQAASELVAIDTSGSENRHSSDTSGSENRHSNDNNGSEDRQLVKADSCNNGHASTSVVEVAEKSVSTAVVDNCSVDVPSIKASNGSTSVSDGPVSVPSNGCPIPDVAVDSPTNCSSGSESAVAMDAPTDVCNGSKAPVPVDTSSVPKHSNGSASPKVSVSADPDVSASPKVSVSSDPDVSQLRLSEAAGITVGRRMSADTKPSLVGAIDPEPRQPHVVKPTPPNHHMRSSIFSGSDEDHAPLPTYSRSSEAIA